ncbi:beta-phosphoglucomutase [Synergistales bacterium]|nr:beta-phosphoglucomutase [Synergistales bacterium]
MTLVESQNMNSAIFDLDGTLIDSMKVWEKIDADFLAKRGLSVPPDYFGAISALGFRETANYTIKRFGLRDSAEDLTREWNDMAYHEYARNIRLKPYAREYLTKLKSMKVKLAVATSSPSVLCNAALSNNGIAGYFDVIQTADSAYSSSAEIYDKRSPRVFLQAADKLSVQPERCAVFEDILRAVRSAKAAGMTVYAVYDESSKEDWEEIKREADGFLYDFKDAPLIGM